MSQFHPVFFVQENAPLSKGKRSAVAGVNDSPVGCQSRDRVARRRLPNEVRLGDSKKYVLINHSVLCFSNASSL